jgi:hypothetical protein
VKRKTDRRRIRCVVEVGRSIINCGLRKENRRDRTRGEIGL